MYSISVVVPVFYSEHSLKDLCSKLGDILSALADKIEVILVNDGSLDKSREFISQMTMEYSWLHGINLLRN